MGTALRRLVPLTIVGGLLALIAVAASMSTPGIHRSDLRQSPQSPTPQASMRTVTAAPTQPQSSGVARDGFDVPTWLQPVLIAIGGAILLTLIALLIWRVISNMVGVRSAGLARKPTAINPTRRDQVLAAVDANIAELARDDGDPRSAVIICWVRLEQVAAQAGVERSPSDTPADLVRRLLAVQQVSEETLDALADLYRAARYSPGEVAPSMRDDARRAFVRLRDELAGSVAKPEVDQS
jgi:Domain of unknown function (DUF4129)